MAIKTKAQLRAYFQTGSKPTQAQFEDLIDSSFNEIVTDTTLCQLNFDTTLSDSAVLSLQVPSQLLSTLSQEVFNGSVFTANAIEFLLTLHSDEESAIVCSVAFTLRQIANKTCVTAAILSTYPNIVYDKIITAIMFYTMSATELTSMLIQIEFKLETLKNLPITIDSIIIHKAKQTKVISIS